MEQQLIELLGNHYNSLAQQLMFIQGLFFTLNTILLVLALTLFNKTEGKK